MNVKPMLLKILRRIALAAICALCILYGILAYSVIRVGELRKRYERTHRGMTVEEVEAVMGEGMTRSKSSSFPAWDDAELSPDDAAKISSAYRVRAERAFWIPVTYEFTFDSGGRLVGRHIYD